MTFERNLSAHNLKVFFTNFSDLDGRIDPLYYFSVNNLHLANNTVHPVKKLSDVILMTRGRFGHRPRNDPRFYDGEYPFIQTGDVVRASEGNGKITYSQTLNELGLKTSRLFDKPVVVITIAANIGDTAILDYPACFPDSLIGMQPRNDSITLEYINLYFKFIKSYLNDLAPQSAQKNINYQQLAPVPIVIPPLAVQKKAVEVYKAALNHKEQKEQQAKALLAEIDTYLLSELGVVLPEQDNTLDKRMFFVNSREVSGKRFDPFFNDIFYIQVEKNLHSEQASFRKLKELCYAVSGVIYSRENETSDGHVILRANNINLETNDINFKDLRHIDRSIELDSCRKLYKNDILMCSASGSKDHVGKVAFISSDLDCYFGGFMLTLRQLAQDYSHKYLFEYMQSKLFRLNLFKVLGGTNINNLNFGMIKDFVILCPSLAKQIEIAQHIQAIRSQAAELQREAAKILEDAKAEVERVILGGSEV